MPVSSATSPMAKVALPSQSILAFMRTPLSLSFKYAQTVPNSPKGTDTRNTRCHWTGASTPPRIRPRKDPLTAAMPLMPMAFPRSSAGKASVRMAPSWRRERLPRRLGRHA